MLNDLVETAARFRSEDLLPPSGFKQKAPVWFVNLEQGRASLEGPYARKDIRSVPSPDRQRSGTPSEDNLKPYLLIDDARYVLGKADSAGARARSEARLLHRGFLDLLRRATDSTRNPDLESILHLLQSNALETNPRWREIKPRDIVAFRVDGRDPTADPAVRQFWVRDLSQAIQSNETGTCSLCGAVALLVRLLPREVVVLAQKCQVTSFNKSKPAFDSCGKTQMLNAPVCALCAFAAIDALDYLLRSERHTHLVAKTLGPDKRLDSFRSILAVFWLRSAVQVEVNGQAIDLEACLASPLGSPGQQRTGAPAAELSHLKAVLSVPWTGSGAALRVATNAFHLALVSANKGRFVLRDWLVRPIEDVLRNLRKWLEATRLVGPWGEPPRPATVQGIVEALGQSDANLVRDLVRTAYRGTAPALSLLPAAVARLRILNSAQDREEEWRLQPLLTAIKLALFYEKEEGKSMEQLNTGHLSPPYLCGRLLAVLEQAQLRHAGFRIDSTLAARFYGAASAAPRSFLGGTLLKRFSTGHSPNAGREINELVEEAVCSLQGLGGFPKTLSIAGQAEFGLGFYCQRAAFRARRAARRNETERKGGVQ